MINPLVIDSTTPKIPLKINHKRKKPVLNNFVKDEYILSSKDNKK